LRIALFTETFLPATDGVVTRLRHTIEELVRAGDEVLVFAPIGGPESYMGARIYGVRGVPFPPYPQIRLSPPHPGVGRALRRFDPDVVHAANPFVLGLGGVFYARRLKVPLVASYHTNVATYTRFYRLSFFENATRWWTKTLHNRAHINLCTSEATRQYLLHEGIERVRLWPQGVDACRFRPDRADSPMNFAVEDIDPAEQAEIWGRRALFGQAGIDRSYRAVDHHTAPEYEPLPNLLQRYGASGWLAEGMTRLYFVERILSKYEGSIERLDVGPATSSSVHIHALFRMSTHERRDVDIQGNVPIPNG